MSEPSPIPFLDLVSMHRELKEELIAVFEKALDTAGFIGGPMVAQFEQEFAEFCGTEHCVGVGSGTDALRFALIAAGIEQGDIVVTVPNTFIATTEAITQAGARPDFVDIDERTCNMDTEKLREYLEVQCRVDGDSGRTIHKETGKPVTGVIPVHLYGQPADMDPILELADRHNLIVIEDAAQAHGAEYFSRRENRWQSAGSIGSAAAFSFYPGKNLGACGEGGAVTTNNPELAQKVRMLRDHGQAKKYYHDVEGYNGRLDAIQAGFLSAKLKHLPKWTEQRRECARRYHKMFEGTGEIVGLPWEPSWARAVYHLYVVQVQNRQQLQQHLSENSIGVGIHYPIPLHLQEAYASFGFAPGAFPVAESAAVSILSLPMFPGLDAEAQQRTVKNVIDFADPRFAGAWSPALRSSPLS